MLTVRSLPPVLSAAVLLASMLGAITAHASSSSNAEAQQHLELQESGQLRLANAQGAGETTTSATTTATAPSASKAEDDGWPLLPTLLPFAPRLGMPPSLHFAEGGRTLTQEVLDQRVSDNLSAMWLSVTALMIGADVLSLYIPSAVEEFHALANGQEQWLMLAGAAIYLLPASMALLSRVLPRMANRIVNVVVVALLATALVGAGNLEPHYLLATGAELAIMSVITYNAVFWPAALRQELESTSVGVTVRPDKQQYGLSISRRF